MDPKTLPPVDCPLVGHDGNAFAILARFRAAARRAGWPAEAIEKVLAEARACDYNHLLSTIVQYVKNP